MPEHTATIRQAAQRYRVSLNGESLFETDRVLELQEHVDGRTYPIVAYFAPDAVPIELAPTDTESTCPLKGRASYFAVRGIEDGAWSYRVPNDAVAQIREYIGFDASKGFTVERIEAV